MINHKKSIGRHVTIPVTAAMALIWLAAIDNHAEQVPIAGGASDFNSVEYFEPPHQQEIKCWLSGAEADPLAGGLLLVKEFKIEKFNIDGKLQLIAQAPQCIYDPINGVASSPGELHMRTGDGQLQIDGEGFLWRQSDSFLTISNQVQTVIKKTAATTMP